MATLQYLTLSDRLACQGGVTVYGTLKTTDLVTGGDVFAIEDQESAHFSYARVDASGDVRTINAQMRAGRVITTVWSDGLTTTFDEWRIGIVDDGRGQNGLITVTLVPLWNDLVERADTAAGKGWVSDLPSGGVRNFEYVLTNRTASNILTNYVIPNCPSWVALGTVDPANVISTLAVSRLTPGALALAVRDALRSLDVTCELRLRRNGTTNYLLDLVTQVGASANTPVFHPMTSLLAVKRKSDPTQQATRCLVKGAVTPDGVAGLLGRARWRGGAPSGNVVALTDRNGNASPIAFDGQWVGNYLLRVQTGRTFLITASSAANGTVTLSSVSTIAADEDFEFRLTEPLANGWSYNPSGNLVAYNAYWWQVTAVGGSTLTLTDNWRPGATLDPVQANGDHVDWSARRAAYVNTFAQDAMIAGRLHLTATPTGVNVGDLVLIRDTTAAPYTIRSPMLVVTSVDPINQYLYVSGRDVSWSAVLVGNYSVDIFRPVATLHRIAGSVASTKVVTVDAVGTAANLDLVEILQLDGAGEIPAFVDHPIYSQADPTGYGIKVAELTKSAIGVTNLMPNSFMRNWANPANPPDGYSLAGTTTTGARTSDPRYVKYGVFSHQLVKTADGTNTVLTSPVFYPQVNTGTNRFSVRVWLYIAAIAGGGASLMTVDVWPMMANGSKAAASAGTATLPATSAVVGSWTSLEVTGVMITPRGGANTAPWMGGNYGFVVTVTVDTTITVTMYVNAIEAYGFLANPTTSVEYGDATILTQAGNRILRDSAAPPIFYEFSIRDLERAFPTEYARLAVTLGANARAADVDYGIDATVRVLRRDRDWLNAMNTTLNLANRPTLLSAIVQPLTSKSTVAAAAAKAAPTFIAGNTTVTLVPGLSVAVNSGAAILATNSSVTFLPSAPTSPTSVITVL